MFPDQNQGKASGIEVRLVRGFAERWVYAVKTDRGGLFSFPESMSLELKSQIPGASDTIYFYINIEGYAPVMQIAKIGVNVIALVRGPSDNNVLPTEYDAPPLTRLEALREELAAMYSELAVREYEAGLRDSVKGKEATAVGHYLKAIKTAPLFFDAWLQLGMSYRELKNDTEAERAFRKSVEIRPSSAPALTALGGVLLARATTNPAPGLYEEAVEFLKQAVARAPWSAEAQYYLGSALFKLNRFEESEAALKEALAQTNPWQEARLMLVNVLMKQRRYQDALDQLTEYLKAVPDSPQRESIEQMRIQIQKALNPGS